MKFSELKRRIDAMSAELDGSDVDVIIVSENDSMRGTVSDVSSIGVEPTAGWADGSPDAFVILIGAEEQ